MEPRVYDQSLTKTGDWDGYYAGRGVEHLDRAAERVSWLEKYLPEMPGTIFELGCGSSELLARCMRLGWKVGGIDFNASALQQVQAYVAGKGGNASHFIVGDIMTFDATPLHNRYDVLISNGFLEHFREPSIILSKWQNALRPGGIAISLVPNMFSINACFFRIFDKHYYLQHVKVTPEDLDGMHTSAGLYPVQPARFFGKYDIHMLIPWEKISERLGNGVVFKGLKVSVNYLIGKPLGLLPETNVKRLNSTVIGVYAKP